MNIREFDNISEVEDIQPAFESYKEMLEANESVIESFENLLNEYENTETRINENYYNNDIKEAVEKKAGKVKKSTTNAIDKLKNQRAYLKRKIQSKVKKNTTKKKATKLKEFEEKCKGVDFNEATIVLRRFNSDRQTNSCISTMENMTNKMNKIMESYYNTKDNKYLDKFNEVYKDYQDFYVEASKYINTASEVRLTSSLVESAVNTLLSENSNTLELRKEYDNLMGRLQTKAIHNGKVLESFSDANASELKIYPAMVDTYQFKLSKLNSDVANARRIIECAAEFDDDLYESFLDMEDDDDEFIEEGANLNLVKDVRACKKEFKTHIKAAKKSIKSKDYPTAKREIKEAQKVIDKTEKVLRSFDNSDPKVQTNGLILGLTLALIKNVHLLILSYAGGYGLGYGLASSVLVKGAAPKGIGIAAVGGLATIVSLKKSAQTSADRVDALKKEKFDPSNPNMTISVCVEELHKMRKLLDKMSNSLKESKNESAWLSFDE